MNDPYAEVHMPRTFLAPQRVISGDQSIAGLGRTFADLDWPKGGVFVVIDQALAGSGLAAPALASLEAEGYQPVIAEEVRAEPSAGNAREALTRARASRPVAVVGIGGGSAIDLAKFVALVLEEDRDITAFFGVTEVRRQVRLVAVPTTTGTGAEVTRIAMLSEAKRKIIVSSPDLVPDLVILDPALVSGLPPAVLAATGLDALCHAMESMLSTNRSALSLSSSRQALRIVAKWLLRGYQSPADKDARRAMLYAAHFAGLGLNAGVVLGHSIGYTIASRTTLPHGITCAMALPACLRYARPASETMLALIAEDVTGSPDIDGLLSWVMDLNDALGVPDSLASAGIHPAEVALMARECVERYPRPNNPRPLEIDPIDDLYQHLAAGLRTAA